MEELRTAVSRLFNSLDFKHVIENKADFLVANDIKIYCKKSDAKSEKLIWGVHIRRVREDSTHILFYSNENKIFFLFDKYLIENWFSSQSSQTKHKGGTIEKQFKYSAKMINPDIWLFDFHGTEFKKEIIPYKI
jgi:hypothetical protein